MPTHRVLFALLCASLLTQPVIAQHPYIGYDAMEIPYADFGTQGRAFPYPVAIGVTGVRHPISRIYVTLPNLSHTYPDDLDIVLVSPRGKAVVLMSDAGGSDDFSGTLHFGDGFQPVPDSGPLNQYTYYSPADYEPGDLPPGLPAGLSFTTLAGLRGSDANGLWVLYVFDDAPSDTGRMDPPKLEIEEAYDGPTSIDDTHWITLPDQVEVRRTLKVAGLNGPIHNLVVRLYGLTHTYPADLDIGLLGPGGLQFYLLMSDAGGHSPVENVSLDFGLFPMPVPQSSLPSGQYHATNYVDNDPLDLSGLLGTAGAEGLNPCGDWVLVIRDDAAGDSGEITGWSLVFDAPCRGDFNRSGGAPSIQDLFDFLSAWFAGCP